MPTREEFMRQMGLTTDDLGAPPPETKPATRRRLDHDDEAQPSPKMANIPAASNKSQSRADFLRSLGIDNADDAAGKSERNATGSQEMTRSEVPRVRPGASSVRNVRKDEDEDYQHAYTPTIREPARTDFTLGPKPTVQKPPPTTGLDAELHGISDSSNAEEVKAMGNKYFQAGDYRKAVRLYTRAIELDSSNSALYSNRSAAYLLGGKQMGIDTRSMALRDADKTIKLKPTWFKGYSRRGDALFKLERYEEAAEAYEQALELDAGNTSIVSSLNEVRPFMKKKNHNASGTWSVPVSGDLHSSVTSLTAKKSSSKTAHDLLEELHAERERNTPQLGRGGNDYKSKELEKYRTRRTDDTSESSTFNTSQNAFDDSTTQFETRPSVKQLPSEFSSDAARDYQNALLESYRKKKAAAANSSNRR